MKFIKSINEIINLYDNYIIDQWGVMHDGSFGYEHAIDAISLLNKNNKSFFIISNSSKRSKSSYENLSNLGFDQKSFLKIVTSGEMIWQLLNKKFSKYSKKKNCYHIYDETKEDGIDFRKGLNFNFVQKIDEADLILACTPFIKLQPIDYVPLLEIAIDKNLEMYCANPDHETVSSKINENIFCMGAIAEIYKKMGGQVIIKGKPDISIYIKCTESLGIDKTRTISIGDSLFHDIKGANNFTIDSILVKSGIHNNTNTINKLCQNHEIIPKFIIDNFSI